MQAIETKYLPPTETKDARIKARCERGALVVTWLGDLDVEENHVHAAKMLCQKFAQEDLKTYGIKDNPWLREFVTGSIPSFKAGYVHVFAPKAT